MKEQMNLRKAVFEAKKSFENIKVNAEYTLGSTVIKYADIQQIMSAILREFTAHIMTTT